MDVVLDSFLPLVIMLFKKLIFEIGVRIATDLEGQCPKFWTFASEGGQGSKSPLDLEIFIKSVAKKLFC